MYISYTIRLIPLVLSILPIYAGCSSPEEQEDPFTNLCLTQNCLLPQELNENSGMVWYDGLIWTINDSQGDPYIYALDTATASIVNRVRVDGVENIDWEEIAQDESYLYIGDFGNNDGSRRDLRIYKISKSDLDQPSLVPEIIQFSYPDQTDYTPAPYDTPFDCEAMISSGDTLLLFTKNWTGGDTYMYKVPATRGNHIAVLCGSLNIDGQVTASAFSAGDHCLYLLGYYNYTPFVCRLKDFIPGADYKGTVQQNSFTDNFGTQTEGIALLDNEEILISCEKGYGEPALFKVIKCK